MRHTSSTNTLQSSSITRMPDLQQILFAKTCCQKTVNEGVECVQGVECEFLAAQILKGIRTASSIHFVLCTTRVFPRVRSEGDAFASVSVKQLLN